MQNNARNQNLSGELEDFLKHTASIRQRKTIEQRAEANQHRQRQEHRHPRYTNAHQERLIDVSLFEDDDSLGDELIIDAEVIDVPFHGSDIESTHSMEMGHADADNAIRGRAAPTKTIENLKRMLRSREGLKQAFLIREILDRPRF